MHNATEVIVWLSACMALVRNGYWFVSIVASTVKGPSK
jgi:hypothetical protein